MLIRVQLRADGDTAHSVEDDLLKAMDAIADTLGFDAKITEQVIEGTPGEGFRGRVSFRLVQILGKVGA